MNVALAKEEAERIVTALAERLTLTKRTARCDVYVTRAQDKLEQLRKQFQRTINQRLLEEPGKPRFAIHERRSVQQQLDSLISQTNNRIDELASECHRRIAQDGNESNR